MSVVVFCVIVYIVSSFLLLFHSLLDAFKVTFFLHIRVKLKPFTKKTRYESLYHFEREFQDLNKNSNFNACLLSSSEPLQQMDRSYVRPRNNKLPSVSN